MTIGRRRSERRPGVRVVLTPRDEVVLKGVARFRIARTSDLLSLFFHQVRRDTAQARLRKLVDAGYLSVDVPGLNEENVYSLGPEGRAWANESGTEYGQPPKGGWEHHLAIVQLWTRLAAALHAHPQLRLVSFHPDWVLRRMFAGTAAVVVADAHVEIRRVSGDTPSAGGFSLEVDLGTERLGALKRKLVAAQFQAGSETGLGLVFALVGAGGKRQQAVFELLKEHWDGWSLVCRLEDWPATLLTQVFSKQHAPLTASPGGMGSTGVGTTCPGLRSSSSGDGHSR